MIENHLVLLGIRGVPAQHGGFETFAEYLCNYLVQRNWKITVYCQEIGAGEIYESEWQGVRRIHIPVKNSGPFGTIVFDIKSVWHSLRHKGVFLTLGYNTAIFNVLHRLAGKPTVINMDGIEWKRQKWGNVARLWFWLNERFGCWFANHLVADHPRIKDHLARIVSQKKISMIPYGAAEVITGDERILEDYGVSKGNYGIVVARAEPENSIYEVVRAFSIKRRNAKLIVLGKYEPERNSYHQLVQDAASEEVIFIGANYDPVEVGTLRYFARFYVHGHQVGGTNPSLVEALGAGSAVLAHDNTFNRWVTGEGAVYFQDIETAGSKIGELLSDDVLVENLRNSSRQNYFSRFQWKDILSQYETLLAEWH